MGRRVAIVGAGAAGLSAAFHLKKSNSITLFERDPRLGGHAWTFTIKDGPDAGLPLDLGFMVMNVQKYPKMSKMLASFDTVRLGHSEMSFSYCCRETGQEYALNYDRIRAPIMGRSANDVPSPLTSMVGEILRFSKNASRDLANSQFNEISLEDYLESISVPAPVREKYILPIGAALWSAPPNLILKFPAESFLRFLDNHGFLGFSTPLDWKHIVGGSQRYVQSLAECCSHIAVRAGEPITRITRTNSGVEIQIQGGETEWFDVAIIATHADQALSLLADADEEERDLFNVIRYQNNEAVLHWDDSVMPRTTAAWASWNYERETLNGSKNICVTYHLNRLQGHHNTDRQYFLTLNRHAEIDADKILLKTTFEHPVFDAAMIRSQEKIAQRGLKNAVFFAGSYLGYGFHEDAIASGFVAAKAIG